jgi:glutathione peroxidase
MTQRIAILALIFSFFTGASAMSAEQSLYDFTLIGIDGKPMPMNQFKGKTVLLVNTASQCGFTPQYEGLEALYEARKDQGLVIVGVPSNDFGGQEPGSDEEVAQFCKINFGVTFPLTDKSVVSGNDAIPVYKWAGAQTGFLGKPKWNFHKYLFGKDGKFIDWFGSSTTPNSEKITSAVDKALKG